MRFFRFLMRMGAGAAAIFAADVLLSPFEIGVGINLFTTGFCALLGAPGFAVLYALAWVLK